MTAEELAWEHIGFREFTSAILDGTGVAPPKISVANRQAWTRGAFKAGCKFFYGRQPVWGADSAAGEMVSGESPERVAIPHETPPPREPFDGARWIRNNFQPTAR